MPYLARNAIVAVLALSSQCLCDADWTSLWLPSATSVSATMTDTWCNFTCRPYPLMFRPHAKLSGTNLSIILKPRRPWGASDKPPHAVHSRVGFNWFLRSTRCCQIMRGQCPLLCMRVSLRCNTQGLLQNEWLVLRVPDASQARTTPTFIIRSKPLYFCCDHCWPCAKTRLLMPSSLKGCSDGWGSKISKSISMVGLRLETPWQIAKVVEASETALVEFFKQLLLVEIQGQTSNHQCRSLSRFGSHRQTSEAQCSWKGRQHGRAAANASYNETRAVNAIHGGGHS